MGDTGGLIRQVPKRSGCIKGAAGACAARCPPAFPSPETWDPGRTMKWLLLLSLVVLSECVIIK